MTKELEYAIEHLYMKSQCKHYTSNSRVHYTAIPLENGTYLAILRDDRYVEDDFIQGLILSVGEDGYYEIQNDKARTH